MVDSGAIMSASLLLYMVKPELTVSEKFEYVHDFFTRCVCLYVQEIVK